MKTATSIIVNHCKFPPFSKRKQRNRGPSISSWREKNSSSRRGRKEMQTFGGAWGVATTPTKLFCCSCKSAAAALYCRNHAAFLCLCCDAEIHHPSKLLLGTRHARVWLCEVCEQAPAAITCNADAAALCVSCDADIHSVNPLARRHERSAVEPFYDSAEFAVKPTAAFKFLLANEDDDVVVLPELKSEDIFFSEMDSLIDFDYPSGGGDGVVPDQSNPGTVTTPATDHSTGNFCGLEFCTRSKLDGVGYPSQNLSQSVSSSSLDVGVVPDRNTASDASYPTGQTAVPATAQKATQLRGMDREARVLRYREKKKNRKFAKTIRYASRKAYAEIRPRIKGRFVKRSEMNSNVDRIFGGSGGLPASEGQYGVVPSL